MEKKPSVFANKINKKLENNERVYFSDKEKKELEVKNETMNSKPIQQQIKEIFNSHTYIYKADVEIKTKDGIFNKRLIGKNNTHIITIDNELIPIDEIIEIRNKSE